MMHPNWVGLATVDFERKIFIKEGTYLEPSYVPKKRHKNDGNLEGEDVKNFYEEVISAPETPKQPKLIQNSNDTFKKPKIPTIQNKTPINLDKKILQTFLRAAQDNNTNELYRILCKCPSVLNSTDEFGWTALMCGVQSTSIEAVQFLLNNKADVTIKDKGGISAIKLAERNNLSHLFKRKSSRRRRRSSSKIDREIQCDICGEEYIEKNEKRHLTSTLHLFYANKNTKLKTVYGIPESNRGYQILLKTGWDREKGLGPDGSGHKFPLKTVHKTDRYGIGNETVAPKVTHSDVNKRRETHKTTNKRDRNRKLDSERMLERSIRIALS